MYTKVKAGLKKAACYDIERYSFRRDITPGGDSVARRLNHASIELKRGGFLSAESNAKRLSVCQDGHLKAHIRACI